MLNLNQPCKVATGSHHWVGWEGSLYLAQPWLSQGACVWMILSALKSMGAWRWVQCSLLTTQKKEGCSRSAQLSSQGVNQAILPVKCSLIVSGSFHDNGAVGCLLLGNQQLSQSETLAESVGVLPLT